MIARLIALSARHRLVVILLVALAAGAGAWSLRRTPLDAIPDLSDVQVIVFTEWMGQSPDLVEDQITYPIIAALSGRAARAGRARAIDVRHVVRERHLRGRHRHLLGAQPRARVPLQPRREAPRPRDADAGTGRDRRRLGLRVRARRQVRQARPRRAAVTPGLDPALRAAERPGRRGGGERGGFVKQYQVNVDPVRLQSFGVSMDEVIEAVRRSNHDVGGRVLEIAGTSTSSADAATSRAGGHREGGPPQRQRHACHDPRRRKCQHRARADPRDHRAERRGRRPSAAS